MMERKLLNEDEIAAALTRLEGWFIEGSLLKRSFKFENFAQALAFVNQVGAIAESIDHHPDITFGWAYADIATTTHDRGGITNFDLDLAAKINRIVA